MNNCLFGFQRQYRGGYRNTEESKKVPNLPYTENKVCDNKWDVQNNENKNQCSRKLYVPNNTILKSSTLGEIILPDNTERGTTYNIASINLDTSNYGKFHIHFNFSCNIITINSVARLRFQIFKKGSYQLVSDPVSVGMVFFRVETSTQANTFSLTACDCDSIRSEYYNYSVSVEVMGRATAGDIVIANPILIATIVEVLSVSSGM